MNTVQNGKGDRPRNNWGPNWYERYDAVDWCRRPIKQVSFESARVYVPPPQAVVVVGMPDSYVWDGVEYVGVVGDQYMYLGPEGVWLVCDPVRLGRFHGWEGGHPDWRRTAVRNVGPNARGRAPERKEERKDDRR